MLNAVAAIFAMILMCPSVAGQSLDEWNIPPAISDCLSRESVLAIRSDINPFYVSGDFDGDGKLDYAVQVTEVKSSKKGILVCLSSVRSPQVIGAGHKFVWDDSLRFDAWYVISRASARK